MTLTLDVHQLVLLGLLSTAVHWIVGRSKVGRPLWSRAGGWFGALLACPACSGWWIGLGLGMAGLKPVGGLPHIGYDVATIIVAGLLAVVITPVFEGIMLWGLERSAIPEEPAAETSAPFAEPMSDTERHTIDDDRIARSKLGLPPT